MFWIIRATHSTSNHFCKNHSNTNTTEGHASKWRSHFRSESVRELTSEAGHRSAMIVYLAASTARYPANSKCEQQKKRQLYNFMMMWELVFRGLRRMRWRVPSSSSPLHCHPRAIDRLPYRSTSAWGQVPSPKTSRAHRHAGRQSSKPTHATYFWSFFAIIRGGSACVDPYASWYGGEVPAKRDRCEFLGDQIPRFSL